MEIASLFGAMINYDKGLSKVTKLIYDTLKELGVTINETNLGYSSLPYFDGIKSQSADTVIKDIKKSDGVIIATTASFSTCSSILQNFFEHLELDEFKDAFEQKNCLILVLTSEEKSFLPINNIANIINNFGGYDSTRILLDLNFVNQIDKNPELAQIVERQVEDFYRIIRQKRNYYIPSKAIETNTFLPSANILKDTNFVTKKDDIIENKTLPDPQPLWDRTTPSTKQNIYSKAPVNATSPSKPNNNINQSNANYNSSAIDNFNNKQSEDIKEITQFFSQKYKGVNTNPLVENKPPTLEPLMPAMPETTQRKTCRQLTASLVHYYQPQIAGNLTATIQINITGNEEFNGHIKIDNVDCNYYDGLATEPDMSIISSDKVWTSVLTGNVTAQKAFMTGNLKIKGNFVLLTKFDQIFNTSKNLP